MSAQGYDDGRDGGVLRSHRSLGGRIIVVVGVIGAFVPAGVAGASGPSDYIYVGRNWVDLVQFEGSGGSVVGDLCSNNLIGSAPDLTVQTDTESFTGSDPQRGADLVLRGSSTPLFGSVNGVGLQLQVPQSDGTLATATFVATTVARYNQVLSQWHREINNANAAAAAAAAQTAAAARQKQQLIENLDSAVQTVQGDVPAIEDADDLAEDEGTLVEDVGSVVEDLGSVQEDKGTFEEDKASGTSACGDIVSAYGDARTAYVDGEEVLTDARSGVGADINQQHQAMAAAPADWAAYWQAQKALPGYQPTKPVPPLKVVLAAGDHVDHGAVGKVNVQVNKANGHIAQAYEIVNTANKQNHCGPLRAVPVVGHVTEAWLTSR